MPNRINCAKCKNEGEYIWIEDGKKYGEPCPDCHGIGYLKKKSGITYINGDLFAAKPKIIVHGCNARGVMGSGFALQIKERFPKAFKDYKDYCGLREPDYLLGTIKLSLQPCGIVVVNAITQYDYGRRTDIRYVSYDAIDDCMKSIAHMSTTDIISMPKIGAGLGGGDWGTIEAIIKNRLKEHQVHIYEL